MDGGSEVWGWGVFEGCVMGAVDKCMGIDGFGGMGV